MGEQVVERLDTFIEQVSKSFERMDVFIKRVSKSFERLDVFNKRVSKSFELLDVSTERVIKPFKRMQMFFERMTQVVRTNANFFQTAFKRPLNGIPFENGKPLMHVFAWKVTYIEFWMHVRSLEDTREMQE